MDKLKNTTIKSISSKILAGSFGNAKYFGYKDKKLISLVEIKNSNKEIIEITPSTQVKFL